MQFTFQPDKKPGQLPTPHGIELDQRGNGIVMVVKPGSQGESHGVGLGWRLRKIICEGQEYPKEQMPLLSTGKHSYKVTLGKGFNHINEKDKSKQTALHTAASCRLREICLILLEEPRFQVPHAKDFLGLTALHYMALWGEPQVARKLIQHPEFLEKHAKLKDKKGFTALEYATMCGNEEVRDIIHDYAYARKPGGAGNQEDGDDPGEDAEDA